MRKYRLLTLCCIDGVVVKTDKNETKGFWKVRMYVTASWDRQLFDQPGLSFLIRLIKSNEVVWVNAYHFRTRHRAQML